MIAVLESDVTKRNLLGRWSAQGSEGYTRTYRVVAAQLQFKAAIALRNGLGLTTLAEDDILDRFTRYLRERLVWTDPMILTVVSRFKDKMIEFHKVLSVCNIPETQVGSLPPMLSRSIRVSEDELIPHNPVQREESFLIVFTKNKKVARLRRVLGGCFVARMEVSEPLSLNKIIGTEYNSRCKLCFPERRRQVTESDSESSEEVSD